MNDLESRVRDGLQEAPRGPSADDVLAGVRRGVRLRRIRRTSAAMAAAAAVAVIAAGGAALHLHGSRVAADHPRSTHVTGITDVAVSASGTRFKAVVNQGCTATCTVIWTQQGNRPWTRASEVPAELTTLNMSPNGRDGWAWGLHLWSTHDGGLSWSPVTTLRARAGDVGVIAGSQVAWAIVGGGRDIEIWHTPIDSDTWTRAGLPRMAGPPELHAVLADSRVVLEAQNDDGYPAQHLIVGDGRTWHRYSVACYRVPPLFDHVTSGSFPCGPIQMPWGLGNPGGGLITKSHDRSATGVELGMVPERGSPVGPVLSLFAYQHRAEVYGPDGPHAARLDLGDDGIRSFEIAGQQAVLSTQHGRVFTSSDGGYTWSLLDPSP